MRSPADPSSLALPLLPQSAIGQSAWNRELAFDKTGALTAGKPVLVNLESANGQARADVLRIAGMTAQVVAGAKA